MKKVLSVLLVLCLLTGLISHTDVYAASNATLQDVTKSFASKKITIKSVQNGKYASADTSLSKNPLVANRASAGTWEQFQVSALTSDGWVGFKALSNNKYLTAHINENGSPVRASADKLQAWECFRIYKKGNDYYIYSQAGKKYLTAMINTKNIPIQAYATQASTWERFAISTVHTHAWSLQYEAAHPHKEYQYCSCGSKVYTGAVGKPNSISLKIETAHPHKEYKLCTQCNKKEYTGKTGKLNNCATCGKILMIADVRTVSNSEISWSKIGTNDLGRIINQTKFSNSSFWYVPTPGQKMLTRVDYMSGTITKKMVAERAKRPSTASALTKWATAILAGFNVYSSAAYSAYELVDILVNASSNADWNKFISVASSGNDDRSRGVIMKTYVEIYYVDTFQPLNNATTAWGTVRHILSRETHTFEVWDGSWNPSKYAGVWKSKQYLTK